MAVARRAWRYWKALRALGRMGRHERWRCAMMSDPDLNGEVYCHCDRCERDYALYSATTGVVSPTRSRSA